MLVESRLDTDQANTMGTVMKRRIGLAVSLVASVGVLAAIARCRGSDLSTADQPELRQQEGPHAGFGAESMGADASQFSTCARQAMAQLAAIADCEASFSEMAGMPSTWSEATSEQSAGFSEALFESLAGCEPIGSLVEHVSCSEPPCYTVFAVDPEVMGYQEARRDLAATAQQCVPRGWSVLRNPAALLPWLPDGTPRLGLWVVPPGSGFRPVSRHRMWARAYMVGNEMNAWIEEWRRLPRETGRAVVEGDDSADDGLGDTACPDWIETVERAARTCEEGLTRRFGEPRSWAASPAVNSAEATASRIENALWRCGYQDTATYSLHCEEFPCLVRLYGGDAAEQGTECLRELLPLQTAGGGAGPDGQQATVQAVFTEVSEQEAFQTLRAEGPGRDTDLRFMLRSLQLSAEFLPDVEPPPSPPSTSR